jgi:hypothetical protein
MNPEKPWLVGLTWHLPQSVTSIPLGQDGYRSLPLRDISQTVSRLDVDGVDAINISVVGAGAKSDGVRKVSVKHS